MTQPSADAVPGTVLAASILLYVGGALTIVRGLAGPLLLAVLYVLYGAACVGLGWAIYRRRRWARRTVLVLCGIGVALAVARLFAGGPAAAASSLAWPVVYATLLMTGSARAWFGA